MKLTESMKMQEKAGRLIPGMTQLLSKRPDRFSLGVWPGYFGKASGARIWDLDGNCYLDMSIAGIGANVLGYADPDVDGAVKLAIDNGSSSSLNCAEEVELAELLIELHPWADMVRYARTGGEAMAVAVRIARACTGRDKVAFCGYHGWHDWYLSANLGTQNALGEHLIGGLDPSGVPAGLAGTALPFRYNHLEELDRIVERHPGQLAAVVMEPIRNMEPEPGFMDAIRRVCDRIGAVWIMDEISAGFRFNTGGAHMHLFAPRPDIAVFSKALGNGYPMAAVIGTASVMEAAQKTFISSTNWTERIGPTAAIATIEKHRRCNVGDHLVRLGSRVQEGWRRCASQHGLAIHVGGIAPMGHFSFLHDQAQHLKAYFVQLMRDRGILASTLFYAMLAHSDQDVELYLNAVDEAFARLAAAIEDGDLAERLEGKPAAAGFQRIN